MLKKNKMCPYCNFTMNCNRKFIIHCKSRNSESVKEFKTEEKRDNHHMINCCREYKQCTNYKILHGKEVARG